MPDVELHFEYDLPKKAVYDWWTDLSGTAYVGKALKSVEPVGREGEKVIVETRWKTMGMSTKMMEKLTLLSDDHWTWETTDVGINILDDFALEELGPSKVALTIRSTLSPKGMKGKLAHLMLGRLIKRSMIDEWKSASVALMREIGNSPRT